MKSLSITRGDTRSFVVEAYTLDESVSPPALIPLDLRTTGKVWMTAKRKISDPTGSAVIKLGSTGTDLTGISVRAANPGNVADVTIPGSATAALTESEILLYDIQAEVSSGAMATIERGLLRVIADVSTA